MKKGSNGGGKSLLRVLSSVVVATGISLGGAQVLADSAVTDEGAAAPEARDAGDSAAGIQANMYFTDEDGNRRQPTEAELRQAADAFQRDLARLAGRHKDKPNVQRHPDGTVSANVAVSKLVFLTAHEAEDGTLTLSHGAIDEDGNVAPRPVHELPEK